MATPRQDDEDDIDPIKMLLPDYEGGDGDENPDTLSSSALTSSASPPLLEHHHIRSVNATIAIRQLPSQGLSFQLWPAATTLLRLLDSHLSDSATSPLSPVLRPNRRLRILEIGSGTGLVGIAAAIALGSDVTVTDLPHVLPNLRFNVDANAGALATHIGAVHVAPLRWGDIDDVGALEEEYDVILASDVVYHDDLYGPLLETLKWLFERSGNRKEEMVFVMAHLRRWKKDSAFFKRARKVFDVEVIHVDEPCEGSRIGVVVYRFDWKRMKRGDSVGGDSMDGVGEGSDYAL